MEIFSILLALALSMLLALGLTALCLRSFLRLMPTRQPAPDPQRAAN
jgi:hypothetical protein